MNNPKDQNGSVFMHNVYTVASTFRHTPEIERALHKAMEEKRVSLSHIVCSCLTGSENLNRYIDEFDEKDIRWCYERRMRMLRERDAKAAALEAMAGHEKVNADYARKIAKGR